MGNISIGWEIGALVFLLALSAFFSIAETAMMAAHTMGASTFVNTIQTDYDTFRQETLDAIAYVRNQQQPQKTTGGTQAHA